MQETKKLLKIDDTDIATQKVISIAHAYVIYNQWRQKYLPLVLARLADYDVHSIGRYGAWKYSSMQEAVLDGKKIAEQLIIQPATKSWMAPDSHTNKEKTLITK